MKRFLSSVALALVTAPRAHASTFSVYDVSGPLTPWPSSGVQCLPTCELTGEFVIDETHAQPRLYAAI